MHSEYYSIIIWLILPQNIGLLQISIIWHSWGGNLPLPTLFLLH